LSIPVSQCPELNPENECLRLENQTLKREVPDRVRSMAEERRLPMREVVSIVQRETILA
jgi:hypothetical protein